MATFAVLGGPPEKIFPLLISDPRNVPAAMVRLQEFHEQHPELIQLFPGALALLEELHRREVKLAIWTGRERESTVQLLALHGIAKFFSIVVCGDDLPSHKPDPAGLREILRVAGLPPEQAIFIGDADVDVLGGAVLAVDTVLITHGRSLDEEIERQAAVVVATPAEAYAWALHCVLGPPDAKVI
jgi:phosphoglycolate phosphatase